MSDPLVSVLMPTFNADSTLDPALESLQHQTLADFEVVVVDDGSEDGTALRLEEWSRRFPQLRPVFADHEGLIPALNRGLGHCRGELVARMDADDIAHPTRLEKQAAMLARDPDLSVVGTQVASFPSADVGEGLRIYEEWLNASTTHEQIRRAIFIESPIPHPTAMVRLPEILQLGGYQDRGWPEDYDLWLRYFISGRQFAKVPEILLSWRHHEGRESRTNSRYSVENFLRAKAHYLMKGPLRDSDGIIVWGSGKTGRRLSKHLLRAGCPLHAFIDISSKRIGKSLRGIPIHAPDEVAELCHRFDHPTLLSAVASRGARSLIREQLRQLQLVEGSDFWCVA